MLKSHLIFENSRHRILALAAGVALTSGPFFSLLAEEPSPGYREAAAHAPRFEDASVWPNLSGPEAFTGQKWPEPRVMVWAHPGEGVGGRESRDPWDPENWLLNGEHPDQVVFDENTDLLLPDSDEPYSMNFLGGSFDWNTMNYRHVTVGRNATMRANGAVFHGNVWIKEGGEVYHSHGSAFPGGAHTFFRHDGGLEEDPKSGQFGQFLFVRKSDPQTSLEMIGFLSTLDRVAVESGTLIVGQDSRFLAGRNVTMVINEGATVALMDGARLGKWVNQLGQVDMTVLGNLYGGLPGRPLTRAAHVGLSYQNVTGVLFFDRLEIPGEGTLRNSAMERRVASLVVDSTGVLKSFPATADGLLHLGWSGIDAKDWHLSGDGGYSQWIATMSPEDRAYLEQQLEAIPQKVTALFREGAQVDGVVFDDFHAGGILVEKQAMVENWRGMQYGEKSEAEGPALVREFVSARTSQSLRSGQGDYMVERPVVLGDHAFEAESDWQTFSFTVTIPEQAQGKVLGLQFMPTMGGGWTSFTDFSLLYRGEEQLENPAFQLPAYQEKGAANLPVSKISSWKATHGSNLRGSQDEEGLRFISLAMTRSEETTILQVTKTPANPGEEVTVSFRARSGDREASSTTTRGRVELVYLE